MRYRLIYYRTENKDATGLYLTAGYDVEIWEYNYQGSYLLARSIHKGNNRWMKGGEG